MLPIIWVGLLSLLTFESGIAGARGLLQDFPGCRFRQPGVFFWKAALTSPFAHPILLKLKSISSFAL
jgi:hypothetical protein